MVDQKITELDELVSPIVTDVIPVVDDPGGTPITKKSTLQKIADLFKDLTQTLTNKTLTTPKADVINEETGDAGVTVDGVLLKDNDATLDEITAKTANTPVKINDGHHVVPIAYTPDAAATATLNVSQSNIHSITMPAGNITIAISNETAGQCFLVEITQDGTGSRTVTWFTTIKWAGGSAPTLTTTASKRDTFGFRVTGEDTYDGFIVGQNV